MISVILVLTLTFIESFIFFLPITIFYLVIVCIYQKNNKKDNAHTFPLALLGGLSIDILQVKTLGTTSAIFLLTVLIISLYKRKVESSSPIFTSLAVFLSSSSYSYFTGEVPIVALFQGMLLTFSVFVVLFLSRSNKLRLFRPIFGKND